MGDLETHHKAFRDTLWHETFADSNFCHKITANIFPSKVYSRVYNLNSLGKNAGLRNRVCSSVIELE